MHNVVLITCSSQSPLDGSRALQPKRKHPKAQKKKHAAAAAAAQKPKPEASVSEKSRGSRRK